MEYVSIGTDILLEEYFYQLVNSDRLIKPAGGLWTSNYFAPTFNEWLDYITDKPMYLMRYVTKENPFKIKCVIVSLKDGTRILDISNNEGMHELEDKYKLNFEKVEEDYDGMYIDPYMIHGVDSERKEEYKRLYSVKTLCLFDLAKVQSYKKGLIDVEPFDYTDCCRNEVFYETKVRDGSFQVTEASSEYKELNNIILGELEGYIYNLLKAHPNFPRNKIAFMIHEELVHRFGKEVLEYANSKGLDDERISYSLAIKSLKKVK